jgi:hypothetical protein
MSSKKSAADSEVFAIFGIVEEAETGRPLPDLVIRAFDRDHLFDDKLGFTSTDDHGQFYIRYGREDFPDVWEAQPDLYLRIYDASGSHLLHQTEGEIRWNASHEQFLVRVPSSALARSSSHS